MSKDGLKLNIVNDQDEVIDEETREKIHQDGLLHREIHVWFYTPAGEIIFQHRAKDKDTFPDLLDATVGGHVEIGEEYLNTALKEVQEETGLVLLENDLRKVTKIRNRSVDLVTGTINNAFKQQFVYRFTGSVADLKVEDGKAIGFEVCRMDKILNADEETKQKFVPSIFLPEILDIFKLIKTLI